MSSENNIWELWEENNLGFPNLWEAEGNQFENNTSSPFNFNQWWLNTEETIENSSFDNNSFGWDFWAFPWFQDDTGKEKVAPSNIKTPTNKAKMILGVIGVIIVFLSLSFGLYIDKKFKAIWQNSKIITNEAEVLSWPTFWWQELTWEYNESQLWVLQKVEQWLVLSTVEENLLARMINSKDNPEIKSMIQIKFKSYFPNN